VEADPVLREASLEDQIAFFARLMPSTLIGRHAVQHIESALDGRYESEGQAAPDSGAQVAETERLVRQILAAGLHGTLNAQLRAAVNRMPDAGRVVNPFRRRLLLGRHDVEAFTSDLARVPKAREIIAAVAASVNRRPQLTGGLS
jgi:hypothetical protein